MTEILNPATGRLIDYQPSNPVEMEFIIRELSDRLESLPDALLKLNEARYETERLWSRKKNERMVHHSAHMNTTTARAMAELDADSERRLADEAKAAWHYADDLQRALTAKLYGYLNINKSTRAAYQGYVVGR